MKNNKRAFTLVELIVVITILAILATIAFISLNGYASNSRDSKRKSDIANIRKTLELSYLKNNYYPEPDNVTNITYSGSLAWYMGEFGEEVRRKVERINPIPKDPLIDTYYAYSLINNRQEYELGAILENENNIGYNIINQTNANDEGYRAYISGNYNKKILSIREGNTIKILGVPTLITTNPDITELMTITNQEKRSLFSINNKTNLPGNVIEKINTGILGEGFSVIAEEIYENGEITNRDINGGEENILLYEGSIENLSNDTIKEKVGDNIISYYKGDASTIGNLYQDITGLDGIRLMDTLISNRQGGLNSKDIALSINTNEAGGSSNGLINSCATQPSYTNASFTIGTPINENQIWQNTNNTEPCYYKCINGYTGIDCNTFVGPIIDEWGDSTNTNMPYLLANRPVSDFIWEVGNTKSETSVVRDTVTGLMWESMHSMTTVNWINAKSYCANLTKGGYEDWRLPDITEIMTIIDYAKQDGNNNWYDTYFTINSGISYFWTSTTTADNTSLARILTFSMNNSLNGNKTNLYYVICTR